MKIFLNMLMKDMKSLPMKRKFLMGMQLIVQIHKKII